MMNPKDPNQATNQEAEQPENQETKLAHHAERPTIQSVHPPKPTVHTVRQVAVRSGVLLVLGALGAAIYKRHAYPAVLKLIPNPPVKVPDAVGFSVVAAGLSVAALDIERRRREKTVQKMTRRDLFAVLGGAVGAALTGTLVPRPPVEKDEKALEHAEKEPEHVEENPDENPADGQQDAGVEDRNALGAPNADLTQAGPAQEALPRAPELSEQDPPVSK